MITRVSVLELYLEFYIRLILLSVYCCFVFLNPPAGLRSCSTYRDRNEMGGIKRIQFKFTSGYFNGSDIFGDLLQRGYVVTSPEILIGVPVRSEPGSLLVYAIY